MRLFTHAAIGGSDTWHTGWLPELLGGNDPLHELGGAAGGGVGIGEGVGVGVGGGVGVGAGVGVGDGAEGGTGAGAGGVGGVGGGCAPSPFSTRTVYAPVNCASMMIVPWRSVRYTVAPCTP